MHGCVLLQKRLTKFINCIHVIAWKRFLVFYDLAPLSIFSLPPSRDFLIGKFLAMDTYLILPRKKSFFFFWRQIWKKYDAFNIVCKYFKRSINPPHILEYMPFIPCSCKTVKKFGFLIWKSVAHLLHLVILMCVKHNLLLWTFENSQAYSNARFTCILLVDFL